MSKQSDKVLVAMGKHDVVWLSDLPGIGPSTAYWTKSENLATLERRHNPRRSSSSGRGWRPHRASRGLLDYRLTLTEKGKQRRDELIAAVLAEEEKKQEARLQAWCTQVGTCPLCSSPPAQDRYNVRCTNEECVLYDEAISERFWQILRARLG